MRRVHGRPWGKPVVGLTIMRNVKKGEGHWEGGDILDAANGKVYRVRLSLAPTTKSWKCGATWAIHCSGGRATWTRME